MASRNIIFVLLASFLGFIFTACASANATSTSENISSKVIAVGDIHGDFEAYQMILTDAGLIDENLKWVGGDTIFVQTGDIADRGPDTRKIIEHLQSIQKQARKKGGKVVTLIGNHEAMNMTRDLRYVDPGEYKAFETSKSSKLRDKLYAVNKGAIEGYYLAKDPSLTPEMMREAWNKTTPLGKIEHQAAWSPSGKIGKWVLKNSAVTIFEGYLFTHGGISQAYSSLSLDEINKRAKAALKAQEESTESIIHDPLGPLWYRGYVRPEKISATDSEGTADIVLSPEEELNIVLNAYGAKGLIIGHTPEKGGIKASFDGRLVQIDTGASKYYGGTRSFLRIENEQLFAHDNGEVRPLN